MDAADFADEVRRIVGHEAAALAALADDLPRQAAAVVAAADLIDAAAARGGRLVVIGVGKAGLIGRKLAATFASTGTAAGFVHPAEMRHGDLGMVRSGDAVLALSNSGSSDEVVALLPDLAALGVGLVAMVGRPDSPLGRAAAVVIAIGTAPEAGHLGLAPSTSTTAMLALGDALALALSRRRGFSASDYARCHPGGALGRKLAVVTAVMRTGARVVAVPPTTPVLTAMKATGAARVGSAVLVDDAGRLLGIFTDGDLRRALAGSADPAAVLAGPIAPHATRPCLSVRDDARLDQALRLCGGRKINELPVIDAERRLVGLLDLQDLVDRGFEIDRD
jgi:arabinose-5-phosphate isomerase